MVHWTISSAVGETFLTHPLGPSPASPFARSASKGEVASTAVQAKRAPDSRSRRGQSDRQLLRPGGVQPGDHDQPGDHYRGEEGGDDAYPERHGEAADRPGAELEQDQ